MVIRFPIQLHCSITLWVRGREAIDRQKQREAELSEGMRLDAEHSAPMKLDAELSERMKPEAELSDHMQLDAELS
ncbi:hypothetical protein Ancab_039234 [Ancistrocladus abbreviatus]